MGEPTVPGRRPRARRRRPLLATAAVLVASSTGACGGGDEERLPGLAVEEAIVRAHNVGVAEVRGIGIPATEDAFVLAGDRRSIFVLGSPEAVCGVEAGEEVTVTGTVERLTAARSVELSDHVAEADPAEELPKRLVPLLARARRHRGSPYIRLLELRHDDG